MMRLITEHYYSSEMIEKSNRDYRKTWNSFLKQLIDASIKKQAVKSHYKSGAKI